MGGRLGGVCSLFWKKLWVLLGRGLLGRMEERKKKPWFTSETGMQHLCFLAVPIITIDAYKALMLQLTCTTSSIFKLRNFSVHTLTADSFRKKNQELSSRNGY